MEKNKVGIEVLFFDDQKKTIDEIRHTVSLFPKKVDTKFLDKLIKDLIDVFEGNYPGYRESNTKYHDLGHTLSVGLATVRLLHGFFIKGYTFSEKNILLCVIAAFFHDIGLIQTCDDVTGTGAKYTIGHEHRSILFTKKYLSNKGFSDDEIETCSQFIFCTITNFDPNLIPFVSEETERLGKIVGSSDLLAQMADRLYLEKLLLLFKEFEEAEIPGFESELDLLRKTENFYITVAMKRLSEDLGNASRNMIFHFNKRWNVNEDFYSVSMSKNIEYLKIMVFSCNEKYTCYLKNLKRGGIVEKVSKLLET